MTAKPKPPAAKPTEPVVVPDETEPLLTDPLTGVAFVLVRDDTGAPVGIETATPSA